MVTEEESFLEPDGKYASVISDRQVLSIPRNKIHNQIKSRLLVNQKPTHMQGSPLARADPVSRKEKEEAPIPFREGKDCQGRGGEKPNSEQSRGITTSPGGELGGDGGEG
jgi:hypothetical protein